MIMSREYTMEEVREMFLEHVRSLVTYWDEEKRAQGIGKLEGLAFSILSMIDGCSLGIPGFLVIPNPHPDDKALSIEDEENYFPDPPDGQCCDIAGGLHEFFYNKRST